jgi:hypothetical protein
MSVNVEALSTATTAAEALANLILVTPKPIGYQAQAANYSLQNPTSVFFDIEGENTATLKSEITDHYVEDNTAIQDHVAIKPLIVTVVGYVGELTNIPPNKILQSLKLAADRLTVLTAYTPELTVAAQEAYNTAFQVYQSLEQTKNAAVAAWNSLNNIEGAQNRQQKVFSTFWGYQQSRTLFTIETPWAVYQDMAIETLKVAQGEETKFISNFEITFKQIRKASVLVSSAAKKNSSANFQNRSLGQASTPIDFGNQTPQPDISISTQLGG